MLWYRLDLLPPSRCLISIGKQRTIVTRFVFFSYIESARLPILYFMCRKRKAHKQTARSSLCASNPDLVSTTPTAEAAPILYSHKAEPGTANDKHGSSLLSINKCSGLLLYYSLKSPFAQPFSIVLDRGCGGIRAERHKRLSIGDRIRVWSCFPAFLGCLYAAISSSTPGGYTLSWGFLPRSL